MRTKSRLSAGLAITSILLLGTAVVSAGADEHRGGDRRGDRGHQGGWDGRRGYYQAPPPVIYGQPEYYPPPVVYGPAVGIVLPGIGISIR